MDLLVVPRAVESLVIEDALKKMRGEKGVRDGMR